MLPSVMQHSFSQVPKVRIPRSTFNRSFAHKTSFDAGWIVPFLIDEALPGDTFKVNVSAIARLATPLKPVMDNMFMDFFFFAVPNRLVWSNFQKFMGEQANPGDSTAYVLPVMGATSGYATGSLHDYFGLPTLLPIASGSHHSLFHRGYNLIWNEWFRDENLQNSVVVDKDDGPDVNSDYVLLRRGKRHDYFTSALPWPQKGPSVALPLGTEAPLKGLGVTNLTSSGTSTGVFESDQTSNVTYPYSVGGNAGTIAFRQATSGGAFHAYADLSAATAATINQLRQAFQIQRLYERDARGGTRYRELIQSHFGVSTDDARVQRPEFLSGGSVPIHVTPVHSTNAPTPSTGYSSVNPQGTLAGFGVAHAHGIGFVKSFTEHVLIFGLVSVRADLTYQKGMHRMFTRSTRFDFYWPALAMIGEQAILNKEIYWQNSAADNNVFGYVERFAEYRYKPSMVTGLFRSNATGTLHIWHLSQEFAALPTLGDTFIKEDPPIDRVIAVPSEPHFIFDSFVSMNCVRPMPIFGVPGMIDHF